MALRPRRSLTRLFLVATLTLGPALALAAPPRASSSKPRAPALVQVKGTRVSLAPPEGFTETTRYNGFRQKATLASIRVKDYPLGSPDALDLTLKGFSAESLAAQGAKLLSREEVKVDGHAGVLFHVALSSDGVDFRRCILVLGATSATLVVHATWREQDSKALRKPLEAAVRSTRWNPDAEPSRGPDLFTLKKTPGLKEAQRIQSGLVYTRDGKPLGNPLTQPFLAIMPSMSTTGLGDDMSALALSHLEGLSGAKATTVESSTPLTVDGLKGHELVARAKDPATQQDVTLYLAVLMDEYRYFLIQGQLGEADRAEYLAHFKTIVRGFQRIPTD
ncbi:hypothetical protein [Pyxidicoccus sp. MSG2]|uniref:hypothetical protein n=1 Tax=Pyxidicoccus sp. MSG2 TaxID=2996790 RepID=UPI0022704BC0|nr:hypothetical protein [Pyxidicoccus sp. MSG2]MCY1017566.1 hypothetical protein [Pyxidicoccus sp. MSG2]